MTEMRLSWSSNLSGSIMRPDGFYIIGFSSLQFVEVYFIFLAIIYIITILANSCVLSTIWADHRLHTPKYFAVANLGVVDIILSTTIIPAVIKIFLMKDNFLSYNSCLAQVFFYNCSTTLETLSLCVLAYDRLIAICFPLRQNVMNTPTSMISILIIVWVLSVSAIGFQIGILTKLSFCHLPNVNNYFCAYVNIYKLSCDNYSLHRETTITLAFFVLFGTLIFIILSYCGILIAVFRMKSVESRYKALATCTEHLILVGIFYVPMLAWNIVAFFQVELNPDVRMVCMSFSSCLPPCLNPIVYSLGTKEIKNRILAMLLKAKVAVCTG